MDLRDLLAAAQAVHAAARSHKRAAATHQREAKKLYRLFDQLEAQCRQRGVAIEITQIPEEGDSQ
jgi:type II secretory pathway component PulJ